MFVLRVFCCCDDDAGDDADDDDGGDDDEIALLKPVCGVFFLVLSPVRPACSEFVPPLSLLT